MFGYIQGSTMEAGMSKVCQIMWFGGEGGEQHPVSLISSGTKGVKEIETPSMARRSGMGRFVPLGRSG